MILQTISAIAIVGIAIAFLNPGNLTMPDTVQSMMIVGLIIAFLAFSAYLIKEKSFDGREAIHVLTAGRISYLVGTAILILATVFQAIRHEIDPWIVVALCAMIFSKLLSRIYSHFKM